MRKILSFQWVSLLLVLACALALRIHGVDFGLPSINDPDELLFAATAVKMLRGPTLDPGWFGHPATTTMYVIALVDLAVFATGYAAGWFTSAKNFGEVIYGNPTWVMLPGRIAMVLFAVATVFLTYRLGKRLFGEKAGLVGAALLALSPLQIEISQIIRSDIMATCFMLLTMLAAIDMVERKRRRDAAMAALWLALSIASKWPFALAALPVFGASYIRFKEGNADRREALFGIAAFGAMALGFLVLVSPYLVIDYRTVIENLGGERQLHHLGSNGGTPLQNAWWYLSVPLYRSFGIAGLALVAWGAVLLARHRRAIVILVPIFLAFFLLFAIQNIVWERWAIPLLPPMAVVAGLGATDIAGRLYGRLPPPAAGAVLAILGIVMLLPLALKDRTEAIERLNDTRQMASRWAREHVPPNSVVMLEAFAFDLHDEPWQFVYPAGTAGCVDVNAMLHNEVSNSFVQALRGGRSNIDYGTMAPSRRDTCHPDFAIITQYDRYLAEANLYPREVAAYRALIASGKLLATFKPVSGVSGGPIVRVIGFDGKSAAK